MTLIKSTATIGFFTLLSRVAGFLRDVFIANALGASWLSDAYLVAFKLPNFFRRLLGEGALTITFVPLFSRKLVGDGDDAAMDFASQATSVLIAVLLVLNAVFIFFMPEVVSIFAPGFAKDPAKFALTTTLSRIAFPYIFFISLVALFSGMLNSFGKFAAVAASPILMSVSIIFGLFVFSPFLPTQAHGLAWGIFLAGVTQLAWVIFACWRKGVLPKLRRPRLTPEVKRMLKLMAPAALGASVVQVNLLVDGIFAASIPGAVSFLYYADRINELPIGVIGVAIGTAILPLLSRQYKAGEREAAHQTMNQALEMAMLFTLPAAAALFLLAETITNALYLHGEFTASDAVATYRALMAFALGLPAFIAVKVFAPGFYANEDTKTPVTIAIICVVINFVLNFILIQHLAHVGLALATSIAGWVNALSMAVILYRRTLFAPTRMVMRRLLAMGASSAAMGGVLALLLTVLAGFIASGKTQQALGLLVLVAAGGCTYGVGCLLLKAVDLSAVKQILQRRKAPPAGV